MGVVEHLVHGHHRGEANIGVAHDLGPFGAGFGFEHGGQFVFQGRPAVGCPLVVPFRAVQAQRLAQHLIELRLNRADADPQTVGAFVSAIEMGAAVEPVLPARQVWPAADRLGRINAGHQGRRTIDHGGVDHLSLAGIFRLQQAADHAEGE